MCCKQLINMSIGWSKITLYNSSFRSEAKNYKGLFYDKFELATIYLSYGQYDDMEDLLNNIPNTYEMDEEKTSELSQFSTVINIAREMEQGNLYELSLSEAQRSNLESAVVNDNPITAPFALSLLKRDNPEYIFEETIFDVEQNSARKIQSKNSGSPKSTVENEFKLYPNPALDYTTLSYPCKSANMSYSIIDIQGKTLITKPLQTVEAKNSNEVLINLSGLDKGTYQIIIKSIDLILWSEKLVIN